MSRSEAERSGESDVLPRATESDIVIIGNDAPRENIEIGQLRVLCIGIAGMIVADALIFIYFWAI